MQQTFATETLMPQMAQADADHPLDFADGMHPAYKGHPACGWIRHGMDRELKSNQGRVNVNINGALSWPDRSVVHLEADKITSAAMIALFDRLAARHPAATTIDVVLDNASYNRHGGGQGVSGARWVPYPAGVFAGLFTEPDRAVVVAAEEDGIWDRHYPTFAEFKAGISGFFDKLGERHQQLVSLITDRFRFIGASEPGFRRRRSILYQRPEGPTGMRAGLVWRLGAK